MALRRRGRLGRAAKWAGLVACAMSALSWLVSVVRSCGWMDYRDGSRINWIGLSEGCASLAFTADAEGRWGMRLVQWYSGPRESEIVWPVERDDGAGSARTLVDVKPRTNNATILEVKGDPRRPKETQMGNVKDCRGWRLV